MMVGGEENGTKFTVLCWKGVEKGIKMESVIILFEKRR